MRKIRRNEEEDIRRDTRRIRNEEEDTRRDTRRRKK